MRIVIDIVVRLAVLLGVWYLFMDVIEIPGDDDGLGTGLLAFLTLVVVSGAWGTVDGFFRSYGHLVVVWVVTGLVFAVSSEILGAVLFPPVDWSVVRSDVLESSVFFTCLVAVPAVLAGILGALLKPSNNRPQPQPQVPDGDRHVAP